MAKVSASMQAKNKELVIQKLKPYLQSWVRIKRAIRHYNASHDKELPVAERTIYDWLDLDELFRSKIDSFKDYLTIVARNNIAKKIIDWDCAYSWKWLESHEHTEFAKDSRYEDSQKPMINNALWEKLKRIEEREKERAKKRKYEK